MTKHFNDDDLAALRRQCCTTMPDSGRDGGRRSAYAPAVQLNVRVRPELLARARNFAQNTESTLTDLVERALDELFAREDA